MTTPAHCMDQAAEMISQARDRVRSIRISLAQLRDERLTADEMEAVLGVYAEFGL